MTTILFIGCSIALAIWAIIRFIRFCCGRVDRALREGENWRVKTVPKEAIRRAGEANREWMNNHMGMPI